MNRCDLDGQSAPAMLSFTSFLQTSADNKRTNARDGSDFVIWCLVVSSPQKITCPFLSLLSRWWSPGVCQTIQPGIWPLRAFLLCVSASWQQLNASVNACLCRKKKTEGEDFCLMQTSSRHKKLSIAARSSAVKDSPYTIPVEINFVKTCLISSSFIFSFFCFFTSSCSFQWFFCSLSSISYASFTVHLLFPLHYRVLVRLPVVF